MQEREREEEENEKGILMRDVQKRNTFSSQFETNWKIPTKTEF